MFALALPGNEVGANAAAFFGARPDATGDSLRGLTFELSRDRRYCAWPARRMMNQGVSRAKRNAVGRRLERRVRRSPNDEGTADEGDGVARSRACKRTLKGDGLPSEDSEHWSRLGCQSDAW